MKKITQPLIALFVLLLSISGMMVPVKQAHAALDSKGTDFFIAFPKNYNSAGNLSLYITSDTDTQGVVQVAGLGFSKAFSLTAHAIVKVDIPRSAQLMPSNSVSKLGITVKADHEVTVYGLNQQSYTTDAYLSLPVDALGFEYIPISYDTIASSLPSQVAIVGVYDGTTVTITPSVNADGHSAGQPFSIDINSSETFLLTSGSDLTGSIITSSAPVAVLSGVECTNVPKTVAACDHIVEMMPPVSTWGKSFVTVPLATRKRGDLFRVLASQDNTVIMINGVETSVLNRGEHYETILTGQSQIEASHPVLLAQYSVGQNYDGVISDPFMMLVPPSEQFLNSYNFSTLDSTSGFNNSFVNVVAPTESLNTIYLDDVPVDIARFKAIGSSGFSGAQIQVGPGSHSINSSVPFGIYVYGFGNFDSYGYPGGMAFDFINPLGDIYMPNVKLMLLDSVIQGTATDNEDLDINGILDQGEDINHNGLIDRRTEDLNGNGVLDDGEDINGNGVLDRDSGLYRIELEAGYENLQLQLDDFVPGALQANFTLSRIDPSKPGFGVLNIIDGAGNTVSKTIDLSDKQTLTNVRLISTLSTGNIDLDNSSFTVAPFKKEVLTDKTLIEWRFPAISIDQIENLDYEIVLRNPKQGENRLVTQQLDLYYTDINGNEVHSGLDSQSVNVLSSVFRIDVDTDKSTYSFNENVLIDTQVRNLSQYNQVVDVKVTVQDSTGTIMKDFGLFEDVAIAAGQTWHHPDLSFNTASTYEGIYEIHAQLLDKNGSQIALAVAPLVVVPPSETKVEGSITTDKAAYAPLDTVNVQSRIKNITPNALLDGYTATTTIYNPNNETFWSVTADLPQLLPNAIKDLNYNVALKSALSGSYRAVLIIRDQNGIERSLSETRFTVQSTAITGSGLSGSISVEPNPVLKTEYLNLNATVTNTGNSDLDNLPITISIADPESESVIAEWTSTLSRLAIQGQNNIQTPWQASGPVGTTYLAVLSTQINGKTIYLARTPFKIAEKIDSKLTISDAGRVLVLLDPPANSDPQSTKNTFEDNEELNRQRLYLENLLKDNDWSYTIVTDKDSFARELRSHAYTLYALFSERVKLDEQVQKELREAIFRGDGLLQAGDHDQRYNQLDDALGTVIKGKHNAVTGLTLIESELSLSGQTDWYPDDKPLKAELRDKARAVGHYLGLNAGKTSTLAIARNAYGEGHTVFVGFDLLAHASIEGADKLHKDLLLAALKDITPTVKTEFTSGDPVAVHLSLTNNGTATSVKTVLTLPAGSEVLDSQGIQSEDNKLTWTIDLAEKETAELTLWLRVPVDMEKAIISAQILIGQAGHWEEYFIRNLTVQFQPKVSFDDILIELQGLAPAHDYQPALQAINKAKATHDQALYEQSLSFLIQASDSLIRLKTPQADLLRRHLDSLIMAIARKI